MRRFEEIVNSFAVAEVDAGTPGSFARALRIRAHRAVPPAAPVRGGPKDAAPADTAAVGQRL
jgi:hypothetical protein